MSTPPNVHFHRSCQSYHCLWLGILSVLLPLSLLSNLFTRPEQEGTCPDANRRSLPYFKNFKGSPSSQDKDPISPHKLHSEHGCPPLPGCLAWGSLLLSVLCIPSPIAHPSDFSAVLESAGTSSSTWAGLNVLNCSWVAAVQLSLYIDLCESLFSVSSPFVYKLHEVQELCLFFLKKMFLFLTDPCRFNVLPDPDKGLTHPI